MNGQPKKYLKRRLDGGFEIAQLNPDGSVEFDQRIFASAEDAIDMAKFSEPKTKIPNKKYTERQLLVAMAVTFSLGLLVGMAAAAFYFL